MTTTTNNTTQTEKALNAVRKIAELQAEKARILAVAATAASDLAEQIATHEQALRDAIRGTTTTNGFAGPVANRANARKVVDALAEHKVNTGELSDRTVKQIETASLLTIYPENYTPIAADWAILHN